MSDFTVTKGPPPPREGWGAKQNKMSAVSRSYWRVLSMRLRSVFQKVEVAAHVWCDPKLYGCFQPLSWESEPDGIPSLYYLHSRPVEPIDLNCW